MVNNHKEIYVYDDFDFDEPILIGTLFIDVIRGSESYSFEYDSNWLEKTNSTINLDPELLPIKGRQYPREQEIFSLFQDASQDRWGSLYSPRQKPLSL